MIEILIAIIAGLIILNCVYGMQTIDNVYLAIMIFIALISPYLTLLSNAPLQRSVTTLRYNAPLQRSVTTLRYNAPLQRSVTCALTSLSRTIGLTS
jgi:hypothetical protein